MGDDFIEVRRAVAAAIAHLEDLEDVEAFHDANALSQALFEQIAEVAAARSRAATRLRDRRGLSLAQLAEELGVSRGRAGQLVHHQRAEGSG